FFFFSSRRRHTRSKRDWSSDVCSSDLSNEGKVKKSNEASSFVSGLRIQREAYPELKADKQFLHLQKSVNEFEERIAATRRTYNARVTKYNNLTQKFPTVMLATLLGF